MPAAKTIKASTLTSKEFKMIVDAVVDQVTARLRRIVDETYLPKFTEKINKHESILNGNGKPGLVTDMAVTRKSVESLERQVNEMSKAMEETKLDRQALHSSLIIIQQGQADILERLKPIEDTWSGHVRVVTIASTVALIAGAVGTFILNNYDKIFQVLGWSMK